MAIDRIIYQSESLFVSGKKTNGTGNNITNADISEIQRVQDMSYNLEVTRTDINEFGQLAALSREVTEPPTVALDFSYFLTDTSQEGRLGFNVNESKTFPVASADPMTKNILNATANKDELNYYIVTVPEGEDVHGQNPVNAGDHGVIGIGNGFISSYGVTAAVGELATATVSVEASNILFKNDISSAFDNPAIDIDSATGAKMTNKVDFSSVTSSDGNHQINSNEIFAIRPGDITIDFDANGYFTSTASQGDLNVGGALLPGAGKTAPTSKTAVHVQSVSLDIPLSRTALTRLGNHFPFARKTDFPVNMTLSATALMTDFTDGSLDQLICNAEQKRDIALVMKDRCGTGQAMTYVMRNAILDTQAFTASIGDNKTVDLTFSAQVGGANDTDNGIFLFKEPTTSATSALYSSATPTP